MTSVTIDGDAQLKRASYQLEPLVVLTRCGHGVQSKSFFTFENERCIGDSQRLWLDPGHGVFESRLDKIVIRLLCSNMLASVAGHNIS